MVNMSKAMSVGTATKTKKPTVSIQTNSSKAGLPSSSPSSNVTRLPASAQSQTVPTTNGTTTNGIVRPTRRPQRLSTRVSASDNFILEKRAFIPAEPYVLTEKHILTKHKGRPPSLIVHLHPTYFRFDQQDGSFTYNSEMRVFIDHLKKRTIPHDLLEEFRKENVRFYDGWLIVKIVDHRSVTADVAGSNGAGEDDKPFSIHNYNHFITPSPYVSYPSRDQLASSPPIKLEPNASTTDKENVAPDPKLDKQQGSSFKSSKGQASMFLRALRPTSLSRHIDLMLDCTAPDPKAKKAQSKAVPPPTPMGTVPPTPTAEKPPPSKKLKLRIDPKDHLDYEAKVINATAPPIYLEPAADLEDADRICKMLADPTCHDPPPSPKSRKRTFAELAADDAHAKEQERFMLIMDARGSGTANNNPGGVDPQAGNVAFQPRFERFNALDTIKREFDDKKRRDNEKRLQEEEHRRSQQLQLQEEANKRQAQQAAITARKEHAIHRQQQQQAQQQQMQLQQRQNQEAMATQQQLQQTPQPAPRRPNAGQAQPSAIPHNMQTQMMSQAASPIIRQGTPLTASSPAAANGRPMVRNESQPGGAGSPPRPGSSMQHGHPVTSGMMRQPSNQGGPSRNGTPQIPAGTPAMNSATPILRQGTPAHSMTQASPMASMAMGTPQMTQSTIQGQMTNGMHAMNPQAPQIAAMQRRQQLQNQAAMQQMNGGQQMTPQMAQNMAQQQANLERQAALQRQVAMQGTPQPQHMPPNTQAQVYNAQLRKTMMQQMSQGGSPGPNQMSPQQMQQMQQQLQMQQAQQAQQQVMQNQGQHPQQGQPQQRQMTAQMHQMANGLAMQFFKQNMTLEAQKYGGNPGMIPPHVKQGLQVNSQKQAMTVLAQRARQSQSMAQNGMMQGQANPMMNANMQMGNMNPNVAAMQQQRAAQMMQQQQIQNAQHQMVQANMMNNDSVQRNYQQQMQQMQQMLNQQQGQQGPR